MSILPATFEPRVGLLNRPAGKSSPAFSLAGFDWRLPASDPGDRALATPSRRRPRPDPRRWPGRLSRKRPIVKPVIAVPPATLSIVSDQDETLDDLRDRVVLEVVAFKEWQDALDTRYDWRRDSETLGGTPELWAPFQAEADNLTARIALAMAEFGLASHQGHLNVDMVHGGWYVRLYGGRSVEFDPIHPNA